MEQSPLERAAKALADSHLLVSDGHYTAAARAVLMAIREPSEAMQMQGRAVMPELDEPLLDDATNCWQAMIDAALTE